MQPYISLSFEAKMSSQPSLPAFQAFLIYKHLCVHAVWLTIYM